MAIPRTKRGGGPRTRTGKAASALNALKTGIASARWLQPAEQQEFNERLAALRAEYPDAGPSIDLLIVRVAINAVKLNRLHRMDDALHSIARMSTEKLSAQRIDNSEDGFWPDSKPGRSLAMRVLCAAALPDLHTAETLTRYEVTLERQISKHLGEIVHLYDRRQRLQRASAPAARSSGDSGDSSDSSSDVQPKPLP